MNTATGFLPDLPTEIPLPKPPAGGGGAGSPTSDAAKRAAREAQQLFEARQQLQLTQAQSELKLLQDAGERALRADEASFNLRLISAKEFFDNKRGLLEADIGNEINALSTQLRQAEEAFSRTKKGSADRIEAEGKISELRTAITLKTRELGDVEGKIFSEAVKARNDVADLTKQQLEVSEQQSAVDKQILDTIKAQAIEERQILFDARERLKEQSKALDREMLETGANLDLKALNERKRAILDIRQADEDAVLSQIRNRELLADKTIFSAARANAAVLDFLQQQVRGVTEIVSDARIGVIQTLFDRIDAGIGKLTQRFGIFKDVIAQVLSNLTKLLLSKVFSAFGSGGGGREGGGGIGGFLSSLFNFGGGTGGFRTPPTFPSGGGGGASSPLSSIASAIPGLGAVGRFLTPGANANASTAAKPRAF